MKNYDRTTKLAKLSAIAFTDHARQRMTGRRINQSDVENALLFGREVHTRGASIFVIGRKEVTKYLPKGVDLRHQEGLQVVCSPGGAVLTVYRNNDFSALKH